MIRKWYNLTLHNGTLEGNIIQFKDIGSTFDNTREMMLHFVHESHEFGDARVVAQIVDCQLTLHDPKADFIHEDEAPEEFVEILCDQP